jgi:hypothetical protein
LRTGAINEDFHQAIDKGESKKLKEEHAKYEEIEQINEKVSRLIDSVKAVWRQRI